MAFNLTLPTSGSQMANPLNYGAGMTGPVQSSAPITGGRATITIPSGPRGNASGSVDLRANSADAVLQSDELPISSWANGASFVADFGEIQFFLDHTGTRLAYGGIEVIDSNGVPHDLANFTLTKAELNTYTFKLPPGRYRFKNISGGALTKTIICVHIGSRNLL